jgi:hypothetical protein
MEAQISHNKYIEDFLSQKQKESFAYFKEIFDELYNNPLYRYKFVLISGNSLLGIFDNYKNAIRHAVGKYRTGDYIVQELVKDDERVNFLYPALGVLSGSN